MDPRKTHVCFTNHLIPRQSGLPSMGKFEAHSAQGPTTSPGARPMAGSHTTRIRLSTQNRFTAVVRLAANTLETFTVAVWRSFRRTPIRRNARSGDGISSALRSRPPNSACRGLEIRVNYKEQTRAAAKRRNPSKGYGQWPLNCFYSPRTLRRSFIRAISSTFFRSFVPNLVSTSFRYEGLEK